MSAPKGYESMRDHVVNTLRAGNAGHLGPKDAQEVLSFLFEANGLLATFEARDKAEAFGISPGAFVFSLAAYQAIEMSTFLNAGNAEDNIEVALAVADLYRLDVLKNTMTFLQATGKLPPYDSEAGRRLVKTIRDAQDAVGDRLHTKEKMETDKPT